MADLLAPDVTWGPAEGGDGCTSRRQVLRWWAKGQDAGGRATVTEVAEGEGCLLVGLSVTGIPRAEEAGGAVERWQVLTVRDGLVTDVRGFDTRAEAAARARLSV